LGILNSLKSYRWRFWLCPLGYYSLR